MLQQPNLLTDDSLSHHPASRTPVSLVVAAEVPSSQARRVSWASDIPQEWNARNCVISAVADRGISLQQLKMLLDFQHKVFSRPTKKQSSEHLEIAGETATLQDVAKHVASLHSTPPPSTPPGRAIDCLEEVLLCRNSGSQRPAATLLCLVHRELGLEGCLQDAHCSWPETRG